MKRISFHLFILIGISLFAGCSGPSESVDELIKRISNNTAHNIKTKIKSSDNNNDYFEISRDGEKVVIAGNNDISVATGLNWYLKYVAGIHISWNNLTQNFPEELPLPEETIRHKTSLKKRYYLNYCTFSYSMAFWDWERWEKELDWMAMHGINLALSITGNEVVWYNVLKQLDYSKTEINEFIAGPAFQAWWQMSNLEGWGGPNPKEWYRKQEILQKKIVARMRQLGIEPVFPGFAGMVPRNIGLKLGFEISDPGKWCGFNRPAFLNPEDPNFNKIAEMYYKEMEKLYGKANFYAMDPFHEGGDIKNIDLDKAGKTIVAAMKKANKKAVWVMQAWQANPRSEMIENLEPHDLMILDLYSEKMPQWGDKKSSWYRPQGYGKHNWLYCMLLNFGGRVGLHGRMDRLINSYYEALSHPNGKTLMGVGATPEGIENNPVMFELLYELPWRETKFKKEDWLVSYTNARYGKSNKAIDEAWAILSQTSYNCPDDYPGEGTVESLFCARPGIGLKKASTWGSSLLYYDADATRKAAEKLLSVSEQYKCNNNFEYDIIDILRQSIADKGNVLSDSISSAYNKKNTDRLKIYADSFLLALDCQDKLLSTRKEFKVGSWIKKAISLSDKEKNQYLYEWNARTLITVWGNKEASEEGGLHDYSAREWNGILGDLYYKRWKTFFDYTVMDMEGETIVPTDFFELENKWTKDKKIYSYENEGDVIETAQKIYEILFMGNQ